MAGAGALARGGEAEGAGLIQPTEEVSSEAKQQPAGSQRARAGALLGTWEENELQQSWIEMGEDLN